MATAEGFTSDLAQVFGSSVPGVLLLLSMIAGYPIAFVHRRFLYGASPELQYTYFILTGVLIGWFNFGIGVLHNIASVALSYGILLLIGGGSLSLFLVFVQSMLYLLVGYWFTETDEYDVLWTMPQCVITLRLIGLAFNLYDGTKPEEKLSLENKAVALREIPGLLEVFAHNFFPFTYLVGPQLSLIRMRDFVNHNFQKGDAPPDSIKPGLKTAFLGVIYTLLYALGQSFFTSDTITSDEFMLLSFWRKCIVLGFWTRMTQWRYLCFWLLAEGGCIVSGVAYNGLDKDGVAKWDGCSNVKALQVELATTMHGAMFHFNIQTNRWLSQYVTKRLKFLNNNFLSKICVLTFLALWHGFSSGYYVFFAFELLYVYAEKACARFVKENPHVLQIISTPSIKPLITCSLLVYRHVGMGFGLTPMFLRSHKKYMPILCSVYFVLPIGYILIIAVFALMPARDEDNKMKQL